MIPIDAYPTYATSAADVRLSSPGTWIVDRPSGTPTVMLPPRAPDVQALEDRPATNVYLIAVRPSSRPASLVVATASGDTIRLGSSVVTSIVINPGESVIVVDDGSFWQPLLLSNIAFPWKRVSVRNASSVTLDTTTDTVVYSGGSAATWTLPAVANLAGMPLSIKNRSSAGNAITLVPAGTDRIYDTAEQTSLTIAAGASVRLLNDGTYWLVV